MTEPKTPRSKPVLYLFFFLVVLTIAFGIVATFRMGSTRTTPAPSSTNSIK